MRVILTGASSFIGRATARELERAGHEVTKLRHSFEDGQIPLPERADVWIHFAWAGVGSEGRSDRKIQDYNMEMSFSALKKATELGCGSFLFAGSQAEYGRRSEYGRAKAEFGERALSFLEKEKSSGRKLPKYIHMRIFSVYGPGDHESSLINSCIKSFRSGRPLELGACSQDWNYLYIDDAARAVRALAQMKSEGTHPETPETDRVFYDIGSLDTRPLKEYIEELGSVCLNFLSEKGEKKAEESLEDILRFGKRGDNAEGSANLRPFTEPIMEATGWRPEISFKEGIWRMLERTEQREDRNKRD